MPVLDKRILNDLQTIQHSYEKISLSDFDNYWNGGIPETMEMPDMNETTIAPDAAFSELKNIY